MSIKFKWTIPSIGAYEITADSIESLRQQIEARQISLAKIRCSGGKYEMIAYTAEDAQMAAEYMSQLKQRDANNAHMIKGAEIATRIANVFAPGCKVVLVQDDDDMRRASREVHDTEGSTYAECSPGQKGVTTPKGTIIVNLGATTDFDDILKTFKREAARSAFVKAGLKTLMCGKSIADLGDELQNIGVIPRGLEGMAAFTQNVEAIKKTSAEKGVALTDADAVEEVLAIMNQGLWGVMRRKFGDGLVNCLAGKEQPTAKNFRDARRIVASILHKEPRY
jgi:hypothetical protein